MTCGTRILRELDEINPAWLHHEIQSDPSHFDGSIPPPYRLLHQVRVELIQAWRRLLASQPAQAHVLAHFAAAQLDTFASQTTDAYLRSLLVHCTASNASRQRVGHYGRAAPKCLSARERTVLMLIAEGQSNKRVARLLRVTPETIKSHLKRVFIKLEAKTRAEAVARAAGLGLFLDVADTLNTVRFSVSDSETRAVRGSPPVRT
jgi:DNA-binding CsgD family transcriptional regulator